MSVVVVEEFTATDLNKRPGEMLDRADEGPVRIVRRSKRYVVLLEEELDTIIENARQNRPQSLADMLVDYDPEKIRRLTSGFMTMPAVGKEII